MHKRINSHMEALIDGKWVRYDYDGESKDTYDKYPVAKRLEYLGCDYPCRFVKYNGHDEQGIPIKTLISYHPQSRNCGHIHRLKV